MKTTVSKVLIEGFTRYNFESRIIQSRYCTISRESPSLKNTQYHEISSGHYISRIWTEYWQVLTPFFSAQVSKKGTPLQASTCQYLLHIWEYYDQKQSYRGVLQKKVFLEILQNLQENTCSRASF